MERYSEIISKSLIDFEEMKFILANNNVSLVNARQVKKRYFLANEINFATANYQRIIDNSYVLIEENDKLFLSYKSRENEETLNSKIEILNEADCLDFLHHVGYKETFAIEEYIYVYQDGVNEINIINLINIGWYLWVKKENTSFEELKGILNSFKLPYNEDECHESIEKVVISKVRRSLK